MKFNQSNETPILWKPFPYAIEPAMRDGKLYYTLGRTREQIALISLLGGIWILLLAISGFVFLSFGSLRSSNLILYLSTVFIAWLFVTSLYASRKKSQVCVDPNTGQAQIQYSISANAVVEIGEIYVIQSRVQVQNKNQGSQYLAVWLLAKIEPAKVFLVVIYAGIDFEVIGAFKEFESAVEFAQTVQAETGLDIIDEDKPELHVVDGHRSYGIRDSKALKKRFKSRPFQTS